MRTLRYSRPQRPKTGDGAFYDKFNGVDKDYKDVDWNTEFVFDRKLTAMKGTLFFLKNNKERLMMDEYFNVHPLGTKPILGGEDDEFIVSCVMANKGTYMLRNIMLKEMTAGSTWRILKLVKMMKRCVMNTLLKNIILPNDRSKWTLIKKERTGYQKTVEGKPREQNAFLLFD